MLAANFRKVLYAHDARFVLDVDLQLAQPGITAVIGPSGAGKTSLIRCLAGLDRADDGSIHFQKIDWQRSNQVLPTYRRNIGFVFQESSLLDHLDVAGNLAFAMRRRKMIGDRVDSGPLYQRSLSALGLEGLLTRRVHQLSLGQQQRVAIACAVLSRPALLLLDEPLASVDSRARKQVLSFLRQLKQEGACPVIYVSHSLEEVAFLADEVIHMEHGRITHQGSLAQVLEGLGHATESDQNFGGVLQGSVSERMSEWSLIRISIGDTHLLLRDSDESIGEAVQVHIPARQVGIALQAPTDMSFLNTLPAEVAAIESDGDPAFCLVKLTTQGQVFYARLTRLSLHRLALVAGQHVYALVKSASVMR